MIDAATEPRPPRPGEEVSGRTPNRAWPPRRNLGLPAIAIVIVIALFLVRSGANNYVLFLINSAMLAAISALALNLLIGYAGQISIGSAALLAIGGWVTVFTAKPLGLVGSLAAAAVTGAVVGIVVGVPALRLRGMYLVLATLALQFIVDFALEQYQVLVKAPAGFRIPTATVGPLALDSDAAWNLALVVMLVLVAASMWVLVSTMPGRAWHAIEQHDVAASIVGVDVTRYKLLAFAISSAYTAMAGVALAFYSSNVSHDTYTLDLAISFAAMIIIGGLRSIAGSMIGAFVVTLLPMAIRFVSDNVIGDGAVADLLSRDRAFVEELVYGLLVLAFLFFEPRGIVGLGGRLRRRWQRATTRYRRAG